MPRPSKGYSIDGTRVPGVTTIISRFKNSGGLIHWAWKVGTEGKDYRELRDSAADVGTLAHLLIENWIKEQAGKEPEPVEADSVSLEKADQGLQSFRRWADQSKLEIMETELSLVSKDLRCGGTIDCVAQVHGEIQILDLKSSNAVYPDHVTQLAAYRQLWNENNPPFMSIKNCDLLRVGKEFGDFHHHNFVSEMLDVCIEAFRLMRNLYDLDKRISKFV